MHLVAKMDELSIRRLLNYPARPGFHLQDCITTLNCVIGAVIWNRGDEKLRGHHFGPGVYAVSHPPLFPAHAINNRNAIFLLHGQVSLM